MTCSAAIQFVPPSVTNSPPRYDLDGNLLSDGRWTYTWDGENRLVKMVSVAWTQPAGGYLANATFPAYTLEFAYDGLSRRVQKKTIKKGTAEMEGYLYDGWNVVMISNLNAGNGVHIARKWSCVWRPDIRSRLYARGSWQAAGGVGGLAWMQTGIAQTVAMYTYQSVSGNGEVHIPMMDHMGNVRHYYQIKTTGIGASASYVTGQITANFDYDAFGREVRATGPKTPTSGQPPGLAPGDPWVDVLPFHFSTKFTERESGLNYYGYRFYDPVDGRWLSRDPMGERGGMNLYGMAGNDPVNRWDLLGLDWHHIAVQQFRQHFTSLGLNIDDCAFGWDLKAPDHTALHKAGWNKAWADFWAESHKQPWFDSDAPEDLARGQEAVSEQIKKCSPMIDSVNI